MPKTNDLLDKLAVFALVALGVYGFALALTLLTAFIVAAWRLIMGW